MKLFISILFISLDILPTHNGVHICKYSVCHEVIGIDSFSNGHGGLVLYPIPKVQHTVFLVLG